MVCLRTYSRAEEAHLDAAYLGSADIDAEVFDESGYGGNLLGMSTSSIRLMVCEDDFEEASDLLGKRPSEPLSESLETPKAKRPNRSVDRLLSVCLVLDVAILSVYFLGGESIYPKHPAVVDDFLASLVFSEWLWRMAYMWGTPLFVVNLVANLLCLVRLPWGRVLFVACVSLEALFVSATPQLVGGNWLSFLSTVSWILAGLLISLLYFSPASEPFVVQPDGESED